LNQVTQGIGVDSNFASEVEAVRQALLGAPQLDKVARAAIPSYADASAASKGAIIDGLRARLIVEANGERGQAPDLYVITYTDHDPHTTRRVVEELLRLFMANAVGGTAMSSETAQQFLTQQIGEYDKKLQAAESKLADFKRHNAGLVPGATGGDYFTRLHGDADTLSKEQLDLQVAEQKRDELRRQLSSEQPLSGAGIAGAGGATDTGSMIREAQGRLDELLLRYTEKHPDVLAARRNLDDLRKRQAAELAAVRRGDQAAIASTGLAANPVYQGIRLQLSQADVEVAALRRQVSDQQARIEETRKMINVAPEVEAEYARLNRDYDVTRGQYQALVERLNRARLSDKADATGVTRFEIVDPPSGGGQPVAPDRIRLILTVLLGGLAAGFGTAYFMHQLRPVFTSTRQLTELTQLPVLGSVSMTWLERHKAEGRRAAWAYSAAAGVLILLALITLATQGVASRFLHGLTA
jgi:polysaccharide chain length determinant protein (PEP-CTERM system associated)